MAIDSITHNFYLEGEAAERFVNAIEESWNTPKKPVDVKIERLQGEELVKFMERAMKANAI